MAKGDEDELKALVGELIAGAEEQRKNLAVSLELVERIQAQVPVCERLQGLLGRLSEDMAQRVQCRSSIVMELHRSTEEMAKMHGELEEHLSELVGEVADSVRTQQETISSSLELASKLQSQVPVFTGLQEALAGLAGDVTSSAQSLSDALTNLQAIHGRIGESLAMASQMQEQLSAAQEGYRQGLQQELEEMRRFWGSAARDLQDLQEELSAGIQSFTKQLHGGLEYSLSQFDSLLSDVTGRLGAVISAVRDSVENIPDEMDRVERALSDLGETLEIAVAEFGDRLGANSEVEEQVGVDAEYPKVKVITLDSFVPLQHAESLEPAKEAPRYWECYADMLSGLLMVFILFLTLMVYSFQTAHEGERKEPNEHRDRA